MHGIGRFKLMALDPEIKLYLSPIDFDPERLPPGFDVTTPASFVHDLTRQHGLFKTRGYGIIDAWSLTSGTADEQTFLDDVHQTVDKEKQIFTGALAENDWDVLVHYFEFTDRVRRS